jgi:peptidoglycan lytic transglycosylase D
MTDPESTDTVRQARADVVLSPKDLEVEVPAAEETEAVEELDSRFFMNPLEEIEKGADGNYAGLTPRIEKFIVYFQTRGRPRFEIWLARSGKYTQMMREILAQYGLPGDLVYLALIESGFSPHAYSVARASGPWQFITGTARRYGLRVDWWTDERRDYEKSTHAAASYLRDLYGMFDSWPLATAAYNAGENKIQRAVARYKTMDYAKLIRHRYLSRETRDYVPKMLAALSIAKDPARYGFDDLQYEEPLEFDKVVVPGSTDLAAVEKILGLASGTLKELNPEIRRFCTAPNREEHEIRIPKGYAPVALDRMEEIKTDAKVTFLAHKVRKRETLASLSEQYDTPVPVLKEINGLRRNSISRMSKVIVPVTGLSEEDSVPGTAISPDQLRLAHMRVDDGFRRGSRVRVRRGDTLSKIARRAHVSTRSLMRANGIHDATRLRAGSTIRIPGGS